MAFEAEIPLIVGLIGVGVAILERGYKRYLEEKKENPDIKFGGIYMLNLLVSTGIGTIIVTAIIPALIAALSAGDVDPATTSVVSIAVILLNFVLGYSTTYRILDALNTSTDNKLELAKMEELKTTTSTNTNPPPSS